MRVPGSRTTRCWATPSRLGWWQHGCGRLRARWCRRRPRDRGRRLPPSFSTQTAAKGSWPRCLARPRPRGDAVPLIHRARQSSRTASGLDAGADDYLVKPFSTWASCAAVRRRGRAAAARAGSSRGVALLDPATREVRWRGEPCALLAQARLVTPSCAGPAAHARPARGGALRLGRGSGIERVEVHLHHLRRALESFGVVQTLRGGGLRDVSGARVSVRGRLLAILLGGLVVAWVAAAVAPRGEGRPRDRGGVDAVAQKAVIPSFFARRRLAR